MSTKLQLISTYTCPFVQRARILLEEKGADYDITYIDLLEKPQWFDDISPLGTVPILRITDPDTGRDTTLFESQVICEYLDEIIEPQLHPADPIERALNRAWIEYASRMTSALARYSFCGDESELTAKLDVLKPMLSRLEALLTERDNSPYFNGDYFSIADAAFAPFAMRYFVLEKYRPTDLINDYPRTKNFVEILVQRASVNNSVVDTFDAEYGKRIAGKGGALARYFDTR